MSHNTLRSLIYEQIFHTDDKPTQKVLSAFLNSGAMLLSMYLKTEKL